MKKKILSLLIAYIMITPITSVFAGTWVNKGTDYKNGTRWKYMNDDGSYIKNGWQLIDGEWYHFSQGAMEYDEKIYIEENNGRHKYGAPVYFVGSDGKMIKCGWYKYFDKYLIFADSTGKLVTGFFMVDDVLYYIDVSSIDGYTVGDLTTTYRAKRREIFQGVDGKEHTLDYIRDGGKVLELDGNPIREDDKFWDLIPYIPKYNSQGILVGEIKN